MAIKTRVELEIDAAFQDVTADVRFSEPIQINRGRRDWASNVDPSTCKLRINNRESKVAPGVFGRYSPRNPRSDLFGKIGRNTPIRVRTGPGALVLGQVAGDYASTPDAPANRIAGDIDLRADVTPVDWLGPGNRRDFVTKFDSTSNQGSYLLGLEDERIRMLWSEDGTTVQDALSTVQIPAADNKRLALRATLETSFKGLDAHRITFYTAPTISGPWTQFGEPITREASTSIFEGSADLEVGTLSGGTTARFEGGIHAVEVRDGIDGTIVANPIFDDLDDGTLSFTDGSGNAWSINGNAEIDEVFHVRFVGEVSSWPLRWNLADTDITTPITASGVFRRMQQGFAPLRSPMYEYIIDNDDSLVAYWPMEEVDEKLGNRLRSFIPLDPETFEPERNQIAGVDLRFRNADSGGFGDFVGSDPILSYDSGSFSEAVLPGYTPSSQFFAMGLFRLNSGNILDGSAEVRYFEWHNKLSGIGHIGRINIETDLNGLLNIGFFQGETPAAVIHRSPSLSPSVLDKNILIYFHIEQVGANVDYEWGWFSEDGLSASSSDTITSYDFGEFQLFRSYYLSGSTSGWAVGHVSAFNGVTPAFVTPVEQGPFLGWRGETVVERIQRLGAKIDLGVAIVGEDDTPRLGPQSSRNAFEDMRASGKVDLGFFGERQTAVGVRYRTRGTRYNQHPIITLDYEEGLISEPFQPVEDDQDIVNDFVASRQDGGEARFTKTSGALSIQEPPAGVGIYSGSETLNVEGDGQLPAQAAWRVHLGTSDELRFPSMRLNLSAPRVKEIAGAILNIDEVDRVQVDNPPDWLPAKSIDLILEGWQEEIDTVNHVIEFNATPALPWTVGRESSPDNVGMILFTTGESNFADTPDAADLRITGDISLRADLHFDAWPPAADSTIIGKYDDSDSLRSYRLEVQTTGIIRFVQSTDGTSGTLLTLASSEAAASADGARIALRVDVDADDGAGGHSGTFYTAETIAGPWTLLGTPDTGAGTLSRFSGAADLEVGARDNGSQAQVLGTIHAVEVYDGIGGMDESLVANPRFAAQDGGTEVFTDGAGKEWTLHGVAYIENSPGRESSEPIRYAPTSAILERDIAEADTNISVASEPPYWTTDGVPMPFDIAVGGEVMKVTDIGGGLFDEFNRTEVNGWGTTPTDHAWRIGAFDGASAFSVSGGVASVENVTVQEDNQTIIDTDLSDAEVLMRARLPGGTPGGTVETNIHLRIAPGSTEANTTAYQFLLGWNSSGNVLSHIGLLDNNVFTNLTGTITIEPFSAGEWFYLRAQAIGDSLRAKVWSENDDEPISWNLIITDSTLASGSIGAKSRLGAGTVTPTTTEFECFNAVSVQGFDVERSVNGIEKVHSGGDEVDFNTPARYAL